MDNEASDESEDETNGEVDEDTDNCIPILCYPLTHSFISRKKLGHKVHS